MGSTIHQELNKRRKELVKEIRAIHDSDLPLKEIEKRMLELDAEMEDIDYQLLILDLG